MDLHNNAIGMQVGVDNPNASLSELINILLGKLEVGEMVVLDNNGNVVNSNVSREEVDRAQERTNDLDEYGKRKNE